MTDDPRVIFDDHLAWLKRTVQLNQNWTLLELGVGSHGFARFYREIFARVIGVDIIDYSECHPGIEFVLSDGKSIDLPDELVDIVVSHSVLEHVEDLDGTIQEVNRILRVGGYTFLSVAPLYYSASGSHVSHPKQLDNWEHLNPSSEYYLTTAPEIGGQHSLNRLTVRKFLNATAKAPWDIHRLELNHDAKRAPDFVFASGVSRFDAYVREFRYVGHKRYRFTNDGPAAVNPAGNTVW